ncbi:hypothetical protein DEO48_09490 [Enterobacter sp. CGMCC 5087]|uniref:MarR family transcriptional regulator n=1 Tax=Enterobacter sp. CGMCC 5087 TaxID=2183878 RepID=UPI000D68018C|nr:helix-turn-helix domain-containing protein [Enterobacter sp. CGMCC 5087]PWI80319.1 hypothetical protein DEO48_09490 [Enterobacter sp. CGMCC 5087]
MAKKNTANMDPTVFEFLGGHPGMTTGEIANALGKTHASVAGILAQLISSGRVIKTSTPEGKQVWSINEMPFGRGNPVRQLFEQLLKECRHATA